MAAPLCGKIWKAKHTTGRLCNEKSPGKATLFRGIVYSAFLDLGKFPGSQHGHRQAAAAVGALGLAEADGAAAVGAAGRRLRSAALTLEHVGIAQVIALLDLSAVFQIFRRGLHDNGLLGQGPEIAEQDDIVDPQPSLIGKMLPEGVSSVAFRQVNVKIREIPKDLRQQNGVTAA